MDYVDERPTRSSAALPMSGWKMSGWTIFEILRYMSEHNWSAYEEALKANPVLAKMMISGVVYSLGDWIAQMRVWDGGGSNFEAVVYWAYNVDMINDVNQFRETGNTQFQKSAMHMEGKTVVLAVVIYEISYSVFTEELV
uniref:Uncharacterized protein n=1 Tax=Aegilops tauschii TaxID=37682 RepID=M8CKV0_AEGTA